MRYDDAQLQDLLAGEYALGALRGAARARFEGLMRHDPVLRRRVVEWQERLVPLAEEITEVPPPRRVLRQLRERIRPAAARSRWWQRLDFWRPFGAVAAMLVVALTGYLSWQLTQPAAMIQIDPRYVAVLEDQSERPVVVVTAHANPWRLTVEPLASLSTDPGKVLQIWAVERNTGATRPLARVEPGAAQRVALTEAAWQLVKGAESLIVSAESAAVVATAPTGPVLYSGPCINLKGTRPAA